MTDQSYLKSNLVCVLQCLLCFLFDIVLFLFAILFYLISFLLFCFLLFYFMDLNWISGFTQRMFRNSHKCFFKNSHLLDRMKEWWGSVLCLFSDFYFDISILFKIIQIFLSISTCVNNSFNFIFILILVFGCWIAWCGVVWCEELTCSW